MECGRVVDMPQVPLLDAWMHFEKWLLRKCLIAIPHIQKGFFFSLVKALACLGLLNILSSCKFLAGICVRNHAKQSLQMLTSSLVWLSQCRVCALFFFHLPSQKIPTLLFVHCCSKHMNYGSSARKDFCNQSQKKVLVSCSTV